MTDKNDVYSFGVVLLELISGRKAVIAKDLDIVQWARGYTKNNLGSISMMADPQIAVSVNGFGSTFSDSDAIVEKWTWHLVTVWSWC